MTVSITTTNKTTKINVPVHTTANITSDSGIRQIAWASKEAVNFSVSTDRRTLNFTPSADGVYTFTVTVIDNNNVPTSKDVVITVGSGTPVPTPTPTPTPTCPAGEHWDATQNKCVPDVITPPPVTCPPGQHLENGVCVPDVVTPPPSPTGTLWDSNINGKWNDGIKRTLTTKEGGQKPDDKSIFVAASGSPKLIIDGDGIAHLQAGSGLDNLSIRLRSRHQGECNNVTLDPAKRFGGHGWSIDTKGSVDFKTEDYHNVHSNAHSFSSGLTMGTGWHHVHQTCKGSETTFTVDGKFIGKVTVSDKGDSSLLSKNSYFWLRLNNSDHGRGYFMAINVDSALDFDFRFEPSTSSIAFRNVQLVAL